MSERVDLLKVSKELLENGFITAKMNADFSVLDHCRLDYELRTKFLLGQVYSIIRRDPLVCGCFLHEGKLEPESQGNGKSKIGEKRRRNDDDMFLEETILYEALVDRANKWNEISKGISLSDSKNNMSILLDIIKKALKCPQEEQPQIDDLVARFKRISISVALPVTIGRKTVSQSRQQCGDINIQEGNSALLEACTHTMGSLADVSTGEDPLKLSCFQWSKNGRNLEDDSTYLGSQSEILLIRNVHQGLRGKYACYINNKENTTLNLSIAYPIEKEKLLKLYTACNKKFDSFHEIDELDLTFQCSDDKLIAYQEAFDTYNDGALVIIKGLPGSGKTTLAFRLARNWAMEQNILIGAKLLFVFSVQVLHDCKTILDILKLIYNENEESACSVISMLENSDGEGACFILDGVDERNLRNKKTDIIDRLLLKEYLPRSMIIATTGFSHCILPEKTQITKCLTILGIHKSNVENVEQFSCCPMKMAKLLELVEPSEFCQPLFLCMVYCICEIWEGEPPNSVAQVYKLFVQLIINMSVTSEERQIFKIKHDKKFTELSSDTGDLFQQLCKLSFEAINDSNLIDHSKTTSLYPFPYLVLLAPDPIARILDKGHLHSYSLSLQEFLAACYIASQDENEQLLVFSSRADEASMWLVWKHYCEMTGLNNVKNQELECIKNSKVGILYQMYCAYLSQNHALCATIIDNADFKGLSFKNHKLSMTDYKAIAYVISSSSVESTQLRVQNSNIDGRDMIMFKMSKGYTCCLSVSRELEKFCILNQVLKKLPCVEFLSLANLNFGKQGIKLLAKDLSLSSLKRLEIQTTTLFRSDLIDLLKYFKCEIITKGEEVVIQKDILANVDVDLKLVHHFLNLSDLILVNCNLDNSKIEYLSNVELKELQTFRLDFNHISCGGMEILSSLLQKCSNLAHFSVSFNNIGDKGAVFIAQAFANLEKLTKLDMQCNAFGDEGAVAIASAFKKKSHEHVQLFLYNVKITSEGVQRVRKCIETAEMAEHTKQSWKIVYKHSAQTIGRAIKCCSHVHTINLAGQGISAHGTEALASSLNYCGHLNTLDLSKCKIGFKGMIALGRALEHCTMLQCLNLEDNKIDSRHLKCIVQGLKNCKNLSQLNLANNDINHKGIFTLVSELKSFTLRMLNLKQTNLKSEGVIGLSRWLDIISCCKCCETMRLPVPKSLSIREVHRIGNDCVMWSISLESLDLSNNSIGFDGIEALAEGLRCCYQLKSLNLMRNELCDKSIECLVYGLENCRNLRTINLDFNKINESGIVKLSKTFKLCLKLQSVNLASNNIPSSGVVALLDALKECTELQVLNLEHNQIIIDLNVTNMFSQCLKCWNSLKKVSLGGSERKSNITLGVDFKTPLQQLDLSNLKGHGTVDLGTGYSNLQILKLFRINISHRDVDVLARGIRNSIRIHTLDLSYNELNAQDIQRLVVGLEKLKLRFLKMEGNDIGSEGVSVLAASICWTELEVLNLNFNNIASGGIAHLADRLNAKVLKELHISGNNIGPTGASVVLNVLSETSPLQVLDISKNSIISKGTCEISKSLQYCRLLLTLNLEENGIDGEGAKGLAIGLKFCQSLRTLRLGSNKITDKEALVVAESLKNCRNLQALNLSKNPADNSDELRNILPHCTISTHSDFTSNRMRRDEKKKREKETKAIDQMTA